MPPSVLSTCRLMASEYFRAPHFFLYVGSGLPTRSRLALAVKAIAAEVWQPTNSKRKRLREIVDAWRRMSQPTYGERRSVAPHLSSAYASNRFKSKGRDEPLHLASSPPTTERNEPSESTWFSGRSSEHSETRKEHSHTRPSQHC